MKRLFIHAPNIHQGGGAVLLGEILENIPSYMQTVVFVDARFDLSSLALSRIVFKRVQPTLIGRLAAEISLFKIASQDDKILCFGNLPPIFKLKCHTSVFLQNRYLVDDPSLLYYLPLRSRLRIRAERMWLRFFIKNADTLLVQTLSMKKLARVCLGVDAICSPFISSAFKSSSELSYAQPTNYFDFIYVASGEGHKNHVNLIAAWELLADEGIFPSLALTISSESFSDVCDYIAKKVDNRGLCIYNLGVLPQHELASVYRRSKALIYPSTFESFGLPLIDARQAGLPILAPELDYVRDVTDPDETFNPHSSVSIALAVKRFLKIERIAFTPNSTEKFLSHVLVGDV